MVARYAEQVDEQDAVRRRTQAADGGPRAAGPLGNAGSPTTGMLAYTHLRGRGSGPLRAALLQAQQQTYGNRALQRFLQRLAAQREAAETAGAQAAGAQTDLTTPLSDTPALDSDLVGEVAGQLAIPAAAVAAVCRVWGGNGPLGGLRDAFVRAPWLLTPGAEAGADGGDTAPELTPGDLAAAVDALTELQDGLQLTQQLGQFTLPAQAWQDIDARIEAVLARLQRAWEHMQAPPAGGPREAIVTAARGEAGKVVARGAADEGIDADDPKRRHLRYGWRRLETYFQTAVDAPKYSRDDLLHKPAFGEKDMLPPWGGVLATWAYKQAGLGAAGPWRPGEEITGQSGFRAIQELNPPYSKPRKGDVGISLGQPQLFVVVESPWDTNPNAKPAPLTVVEGDTPGDSSIQEHPQDPNSLAFFSADELARS